MRAMSYAAQGIPYPARYDYGSRSGYPTLAVVFHMAEGTNVAQYLSTGAVARGVSVHYTIEQGGRFGDGEIVSLRRGSCTLHGSGSIGLGGSPSDPGSACVRFDVLRFAETQPGLGFEAQ